MTSRELDKLFEILISQKQRGHLSGLWTSVPETIRFMKSNRVVAERNAT
jgi:putative spermidine/putrescine transport system substrate-binding protein